MQGARVCLLLVDCFDTSFALCLCLQKEKLNRIEIIFTIQLFKAHLKKKNFVPITLKQEDHPLPVSRSCFCDLEAVHMSQWAATLIYLALPGSGMCQVQGWAWGYRVNEALPWPQAHDS